MKGIIFTSFISFVEKEYGLAMVEQLLDATKPESGFVYTSVGNYDSQEIMQCLSFLSQKLDCSISSLAKSFGTYLFSCLSHAHQKFISNYDDSMSCLYHLETEIHKQVRKIYQKTSLPTFDVQLSNDKTNLNMLYISDRPLSDLAEGLILGCIKHYNNDYSVTRKDLPPKDGTHALFTIIRNS